jgi:hypothetical protein
METGKPRTADLSDIAEKAVEVDRLITQAKKLSDELVATVGMLNSIVGTQEPKDGN